MSERKAKTGTENEETTDKLMNGPTSPRTDVSSARKVKRAREMHTTKMQD